MALNLDLLWRAFFSFGDDGVFQCMDWRFVIHVSSQVIILSSATNLLRFYLVVLRFSLQKTLYQLRQIFCRVVKSELDILVIYAELCDILQPAISEFVPSARFLSFVCSVEWKILWMRYWELCGSKR
jgi:hypothetical protein